MAERTIVVLGGALSGPTAAARARETDEFARIVLVERNTRVSYATCGLAYHLSGEVKSAQELDPERKELFESAYRIEVWLQSEATALDPFSRTLTIARGEKTEALRYDALIVALGADSPVPRVQGLSGKNVRAFRNLDDLAALKAALARGKKRVAVLGGGPMGLEAADGLLRSGAQVTVIERGAHLLPQFGLQAAAAAKAALTRKAQLMLEADVVSAVGSKGRVERLVLADGRNVEVDAVVIAAGLRPRTSLLGRAGALLAADGTALVNDRAETSLADVYACGVCVSVPSVVTGRPVWTAQGALADKTAQVAGANAAGAALSLGPATGSMVLRVGDVVVGRAGLTLDEAKAHLGPDLKVSTVHASSHDAWFPGAQPLLVELLWDERSRRVVGMECVGGAGVDKRVDVAATAIAGCMTLDDLAGLDLAYAPPFSTARDPINVAATVAASHARGWIRSIGPAQLHQALGKYAVLDVRPAKAFKAGTVPGAKSLPLEALRDAAAKLDKKAPLVVFCDTGRKGYLAARLLQQRGAPEVYNLGGGLSSWKLLGFPVERGQAS